MSPSGGGQRGGANWNVEPSDLPRTASIARESIRADLFEHLDPATAGPLVDLQWRARVAAWRAAAGELQTRVVVLDGQDVGHLAVGLGDGELRLLDLALVPGARGTGLGRAVVAALLDEAAASNATTVLHVDPHNAPAVALYRSLGFQQTAASETHLRMELPAPA